MTQRPWTWQETNLLRNLCDRELSSKRPFRSRLVAQVAQLLGRTLGSVSAKMMNDNLWPGHGERVARYGYKGR